MTDQPILTPDDEALAAYLAGDLDASATAAVEGALDDPAVAARLDAIADAILTVRGVDAVTPPDGYEARLDARLAEARSEPAAPRSSGSGASTGAAADGASVTAIADARPGRSWNRVGAAAAVLTLLAVVSLGVVQGITGQGTADSELESTAGDSAFEDSDESLQDESFSADESVDGSADGVPPVVPTPQAAPEENAAAGADEEMADAGEDVSGDGDDGDDVASSRGGPGVPPAAEATSPGPPAVDTTSVAVPTDADLVAQFSGLPEIAAALGTPIDAARDQAAAALRALGTAPAVEGSAADACVATNLGGRDPAWIVRVQAVLYADQPATAYVVATSTDGVAIDRAEVVIVEPATCTTIGGVVLSPR